MAFVLMTTRSLSPALPSVVMGMVWPMTWPAVEVTMLGPAAGAGPGDGGVGGCAAPEARKYRAPSGRAWASAPVEQIVMPTPLSAADSCSLLASAARSLVWATSATSALVAYPASSALVARLARSDVWATPATSALVARPARSARVGRSATWLEVAYPASSALVARPARSVFLAYSVRSILPPAAALATSSLVASGARSAFAARGAIARAIALSAPCFVYRTGLSDMVILRS